MYKRLLDLVEDIAGARKKTIFKRPVSLMIDFEQSFIKAIHPFEAGRTITCCFFHFIANIKKKARPIIEAIKRAEGKNSLQVKLAEKTKRAIMMLPLLPVEMITIEVVQTIFGRWSAAFPRCAGVFAKLCRHIVKTTSDRLLSSRYTSGVYVAVLQEPTTRQKVRTQS